MKNVMTIEKAIVLTSKLNISLIIGFHVYIRKSLESKRDTILKDIDGYNKKDEKYVDLLVEKDRYSEIYMNHLMINTFLMLYSHFEEYLYLAWKAFGKKIELKSNRGSISMYKPFLQNVFKMNLSKDPDWGFLIDAEKIRNCLLHANGRVDLAKKKDELENLIKKHKNYLHIQTKRLKIAQDFLIKLDGSIQSIICKVEIVDNQSNSGVV